MGSLSELGEIDARKHPLKWTEGHVWVSERPIRTNNPTFNYRYVLIKNDNHSNVYEKGVVRQAQLDAIQSYGEVGFHDEWNKHKICFKIFYPDLDATSDESVQIQLLSGHDGLGMSGMAM